MSNIDAQVVGYLYITDVCPRFEFEELDSYRISRMFGENLLKTVPLYAELSELDSEGNIS